MSMGSVIILIGIRHLIFICSAKYGKGKNGMKLEYMNDKFPFGDVNSGFDFEKMAKIVRDFTGLIKTHCLDCDARFLCHRCYIHFAKNGVFTVDPAFCEKKRKVFKSLEKLIELKEEKVI
jgi:sulfatase maturation enzyme AslB (radical SAM superfamily)